MTTTTTMTTTTLPDPRATGGGTRRLALGGLVIGAGVGVGSLLGRSRLFRRPARPITPLTPSSNGQLVALGPGHPDAPMRGEPRAPVSLVLFSDLECPMCRRHAVTLDRALAEYRGQVNLVYRHYPMAGRGEEVARATEAAREQGKFWEMHQRLCRREGATRRNDLIALATTVGLDLARFNRALDGEQAKKRVAEDMMAARGLGITGTPTTFVNGRVLVGAEPYESLKKLIDAELQSRRRSG